MDQAQTKEQMEAETQVNMLFGQIGGVIEDTKNGLLTTNDAIRTIRVMVMDTPELADYVRR
jgi:iron only hydrogenase large subunit-like protein